jgi:hypothetical protein
MSLNIEEVSQIFDDFEDEVMKKCIDECDKSIANILENMKNPQIDSKSYKLNKWFQYVRAVKKELDSKSEEPIPYKQALSEASKRRKTEKNSSLIIQQRKQKIEENRRSVRFTDLTEKTEQLDIEPKVKTKIPVSTNTTEVYIYKFIHNEISIGSSKYVYKSYKDCLCAGLSDYLQYYSKDFNINMINHPSFRTHFYMEKLSYNVKLFFNCWIKKYFDIIYDEDFVELIEDFDIFFLRSIPYNELEYIIQIFETISKNQKNTFPCLKINSKYFVG